MKGIKSTLGMVKVLRKGVPAPEKTDIWEPCTPKQQYRRGSLHIFDTPPTCSYKQQTEKRPQTVKSDADMPAFSTAIASVVELADGSSSMYQTLDRPAASTAIAGVVEQADGCSAMY